METPFVYKDSECTFISNEAEEAGALLYSSATTYPVSFTLQNIFFEDNTNMENQSGNG